MSLAKASRSYTIVPKDGRRGEELPVRPGHRGYHQEKAKPHLRYCLDRGVSFQS